MSEGDKKKVEAPAAAAPVAEAPKAEKPKADAAPAVKKPVAAPKLNFFEDFMLAGVAAGVSKTAAAPIEVRTFKNAPPFPATRCLQPSPLSAYISLFIL